VDLPELSQREIRRRLRAVWAQSEHLRRDLPPDNPHNQIVTIRDIAAYIQEPFRILLDTRLEDVPPRCTRGCVTINECSKRCRGYNKLQQMRLSKFFNGWDHGTLVKAQVAGKWLIVDRSHVHAAGNASLEKVAAASRPPISRRIELTDQGPRLKWP
jgi:hypothetical protein